MRNSSGVILIESALAGEVAGVKLVLEIQVFRRAAAGMTPE